MKRFLYIVALSLASASVAAGQTSVEAAREELNRGAQKYRVGNYAEAQRHFERALELDPSFRNAPTLIARAIMQQHKPGDTTPENVAKGREALAAYERILADDPDSEEAFNAIVYLYRQMNEEEMERQWLWRHATDASVPAGKRARAYIILASIQWDCAYDITETNRKAVPKRDESVIRYVRPKSQADMDKARGCVAEGLSLAEQAISLDAANPNAWSQKANLMRELSKLAEMENDAGQKAYYEQQFEDALAKHTRLSEEARKKKEAEEDRKEKAAKAASLIGDNPSASSTPQQPDAPKRTIINGGVLNGKAVSKPAPAYPDEARKAGAQGTVTVNISVDEEGRVVTAEAVSGHPLLHEAAVGAARRARFTQTFLQGQPVWITGHLTYNFVLQ